MRNLKFKYAQAKNFLCFGPEGIELYFDNYGNIVPIMGENCDVKPIITPDNDTGTEDHKTSSNGAGKTSIPAILVYGLYGKTINKPSKIGVDDVINNIVQEKLYIEVIWDKYRVVRKRKPDALDVWESEEHIWNKDTKKTQGTKVGTQQYIIDRLGLSYETFVNICVFSDDNSLSFLECSGPQKREIAENLLSLGKYRDWGESAKQQQKEAKDAIKTLGKEYEMFLANKSKVEHDLEVLSIKEKNWRMDRSNEVKRLREQVKLKHKELQASDQGAALAKYRDAQDCIKELNGQVPPIESNLKKLGEMENARLAAMPDLRQKRNEAEQKYQQHMLHTKRLDAERTQQCNLIDSLEKNKGTTCPTCYGLVDETNFKSVVEAATTRIEVLSHEIFEITELALDLKHYTEGLDEDIVKLRKEIEAIQDKIRKFNTKLVTIRSEISEQSKVREPQVGTTELLLEQQIAELKKQAKEKEEESEGVSPYAEILATARDGLDATIRVAGEKKQQIKEAEGLLPYYDYWTRAFGDNGIRKWIIEGVIPALNSRIAYWLQFLIDNKITLQFDSQLNEKIQRNPPDGDPFIYHAMSGGERRRLNLAVSQAFAHVMMLNTGASPSLVFLDEVTTNIDRQGVVGIYNMICELANDKQVFVTTHDQELLEMLSGCQAINLRREGGITKLIADNSQKN